MQLRTQEEITAKWPENAEPIVCVRCITFKQEKFIAKCLEGFLIQETDFPFEIMIHEDASPDRTADIIREYEAKYPRILKPLYETENQWKKQDGTFTRIVTGMLKRKYVAMCEGDDYWTDPHKLQQQIDFLESHPDYSMIFHGATVVDADGNPSPDDPYAPLEDRDYNASELYENWVVPTASMIYRREVLNYKIKNPDNILNGDIFLVEKCAHSGMVRCINKKMSAYRKHAGGVTWDEKLKIKRALALPNHIRELKVNFTDINSKRINKDLCRSLIHVAHIEGKRKHLRDLIEAFFLSPSTFIKALRKKKIFSK